MEENTGAGNEVPEDTINTELEKSSNENVLSVESDNIPPKQEIVNMEVHHHPDLHHKPKKWKEYLLEFLMIFLAVSLGFFAENIRENLRDHSREKEYIHNIRNDLVADTVSLNIWIPAMRLSIGGFDTLISILQKPGNTQRGSEMYLLARLATRTRLFESNDNTMLELKSSGNLRLIQDMRILKELENIEKIKARYLDLNGVATREKDLLYPLIGNLFDASVFNKMVITPGANETTSEKDFAEASKNFIQKPPGNPQLMSNNRELINQLIYYLHQRKTSFDGEIRVLNTLKQASVELIQLLNAKYHLDND